MAHCSLEEDEEEVGPVTLQQLLTECEHLLLHWLQHQAAFYGMDDGDRCVASERYQNL